MTMTGKFHKTRWCKDDKKSLRLKRRMRERERLNPESQTLRANSQGVSFIVV